MIANSESFKEYSEGLMILLFSMKKGSLKETEKLLGKWKVQGIRADFSDSDEPNYPNPSVLLFC